MMDEDEKKSAKVDYVIDENASRIETPDDATLRPADTAEKAVAGTGPANWSRWGMVGLGALVLVLLVFQLMYGGASTQVQPGTPTVQPDATAPVTTTPAPDAP